MNTAELREAYLAFFETRGHRRVPSSTLVPQNDPTLLFTNAGMNQFKDPLLGRSNPGYTRATSAQRCVRAGGKHNDLENVGYTARHHTFFEMLGNFSFGDYFKEETIVWAWEFVADVLQIPTERIWVTVHPSDDDSRRIWQGKIGLPADRVIDLEENFWTMGDTGPCGPCTELFYDHGPAIAGGPPGSADEDGDRFIEFWNLVFPQFDRTQDGQLLDLPKPGVDTGMGLERTAAIMQGVHSNYEIDLFRHLIRAAGHFAGITDEAELSASASLRVIADHIRSSAFLIADGVMPGNEDRAYVLRRIIRRGLRHGHKLNITQPFFHKLVPALVDEMGVAYPELAERQSQVTDVLRGEEERFSETLSQGMDLLRGRIDALQGDTIPGEVVFQLYDTYGFPADLTADIARERNLQVDMAGFDAAMEAQRARGRAAATFSASLGQRVNVAEPVEFRGYDGVDASGSVLALFDLNGDPLERLESGTEGVVVLDRTAFYAESGGQVGDQGVLRAGEVQFDVTDTKLSGVQHMHIGKLISGTVAAGMSLETQVDNERRARVRRNHSATHLLHAALRRTLGSHVQQKGSLVNDEKLRFDFSHPEPLTAEQLRDIDDLVNRVILANSEVQTEVMDYDAAVKRGAIALFGEKYGDEVRVLTMGDGYSVELCGGTHVSRTGDIGLFNIVGETGIASGVRRVEAITGAAAVAAVRDTQDIVERAARLLKSNPQQLEERVAAMAEENRSLHKSLGELNQRLAQGKGMDFAAQAKDINGVKLLTAKIDGDTSAMMNTLDDLKSRLDRAVFVLAQEREGSVSMVVSVSKSLCDTIRAPELLRAIGDAVGVKGGGRPDLARAGGGDNPAGLDAAFELAAAYVAERLV